ncbi:GNAT family N-acetyltransferase [Flavobacterium sp. KBS0721]|uniref:GNAT family N-acetyltransferase n=1 Tax=Flavobacterium sp. KBS0721 TaxID=1179672 RepID=UPI00098F39DE|nr:GNAT family N-acetyltransferase [Flavobacterium sp. KBS0721]QDW22711.1 GNAT family N-acetyltransferase [Flavobacterium sp. KBS0721]
MEIREIRNTDFNVLRKLFLKQRQDTFFWLDPTEFKLDDFEKHIKGELVLVAIEENIPVGFISIWMPNNFIHHFYIDQKYQGKGIGTLLLKAVIQQTQFPITLKCLEQNTKAVAFYRKKGFIEKERGPSEHGDYILFELLEDLH